MATARARPQAAHRSGGAKLLDSSHMIVGTNRIATMPSRLADHYAQTLPLRVLPLPLPLPKFTEALQWPALHHKDPASLWLRELILTEAKDLSDNWPGKI